MQRRPPVLVWWNDGERKRHDTLLLVIMAASGGGGWGFGEWQESVGAGVFMSVTLFSVNAIGEGISDAIRGLGRRE
jgi:hypothetical protein